MPQMRALTTDLLAIPPMHKLPHTIFPLAMAAVLTCATACRNTARYYVFQPVNPQGWLCTDTLRFEVPPDSTAEAHTFSLEVRFTNEIAYQGLWLVLERRTLPPKRDTLYLPLATENGEWDAGGVVFHEASAVCTTSPLPSDASLQLLVYHIMPEQELRGVNEVGVKVE